MIVKIFFNHAGIGIGNKLSCKSVPVNQCQRGKFKELRFTAPKNVHIVATKIQPSTKILQSVWSGRVLRSFSTSSVTYRNVSKQILNFKIS
jgi:hypothetical protein